MKPIRAKWAKGLYVTAVCDVCSDPATQICVASGTGTFGRAAQDYDESRRIRITVYACEEHYSDVLDGLVEQYGGASNWYDRDLLAEAVQRAVHR